MTDSNFTAPQPRRKKSFQAKKQGVTSRLHAFILPLFSLIISCNHKIILPGDPLDPVQSDMLLLHVNDHNSFLLNPGHGMENFGGAARIASLIRKLRGEAEADVYGSPFIAVSSGGNFHPGQVFDMSVKKGIPYYDAMAMDIMEFDAILISDRDFAMGPDILANFIGSFKLTRPVFLSANLDISAEPKLLSLQKAGRIAKSTIVERGRSRFGIIGVTNPDITRLYSYGKAVFDPDIVSAVQQEADKLVSYGIDKIVLLADFKDLKNDMKVIGQLRNIDVVVTGGGMELMADRHTPLLPTESLHPLIPFSAYPALAEDADKKIVPVVTTPGRFTYAGLLRVNFDSDGLTSHISRRSGLVRVLDEQTGELDASQPDQSIQKNIILPIAKTLSTQSAVIAENHTHLDGNPRHMQSRETNLGTLCADAVLWAARENANRFGTRQPNVAIISAGSILGSIEKGRVSEADIFRISSFSHFVSVVENVSPEDFKNLIEKTLAKLISDPSEAAAAKNTGFPQFGNCSIVYNPTRAPGNRLKELRTASGAMIVKDYRVVEFAPSEDIATLEFLARGGEGWSFGNNRSVNMGIPMPNAINSFISAPKSDGGLGKVISESDYKPGDGKTIFVTRE